MASQGECGTKERSSSIRANLDHLWRHRCWEDPVNVQFIHHQLDKWWRVIQEDTGPQEPCRWRPHARIVKVPWRSKCSFSSFSLISTLSIFIASLPVHKLMKNPSQSQCWDNGCADMRAALGFTTSPPTPRNLLIIGKWGCQKQFLRLKDNCNQLFVNLSTTWTRGNGVGSKGWAWTDGRGNAGKFWAQMKQDIENCADSVSQLIWLFWWI